MKPAVCKRCAATAGSPRTSCKCGRVCCPHLISANGCGPCRLAKYNAGRKAEAAKKAGTP
jgi:hypothetical protein